MKKIGHVKGFIEISVFFIIALSLVIAAVITLTWSKPSLSVSHLKRFQAINYAEAALYEAFNRFRNSYNDWEQWLLPTSLEPSDTTIEIDGITVTISGEIDNMGTPADTSDDRNEVLATIDQEQIDL